MSHSVLLHSIRIGRNAARSLLPAPVRKITGAFCGHTFQKVVRPFCGFLFDTFEKQYKTDGCVFDIPRDQTDRSFRACFFFDDYENEEREMIRRHVVSGDSVLEYGGCIGVVSCTTNKLLQKGSKHVVIEANPHLVPAIERNRDLNACSFEVLHAAAGGTDVPMTFYFHPEFITRGSTVESKVESVLVETLPLGIAIKKFGRFSVLILDVEGGELDLIEHGQNELKEFRLIILELHEFAYGRDGLHRCRELLKSSGFEKTDCEADTEVWINMQLDENNPPIV